MAKSRGRQRDLQFGREPEARAAIQLAEVDLGGHGGVGEVGALLPGHQAECRVEAGSISGGKELLGVGPPDRCRQAPEDWPG